MIETFAALCHFGVDRQGCVTFAPNGEGELGSELFDTNYSTRRIRPWDERRRQAFAVSQGYYEIYHRTGDARIERIAAACVGCGTDLRFQELHCEQVGVTKLRLKRANFCRGRLCPLCNWRRSLRLKYELGKVLDAIQEEEPELRLLMLTLTVPNPSYADFGEVIGELQAAVARLMRYKRVTDAVRARPALAQGFGTPLCVAQIGVVSLDGAAMLLSSGRRPHGESKVGSRNPLESGGCHDSTLSKPAADKGRKD